MKLEFETKLTKWQKWYLKYFDRAAYKRYKLLLPELPYLVGTQNLIHPNLNHLFKTETSFVHSGNSGDIIYALPALYELSKKGSANLFLKSNQPGVYKEFHPLGDVMLNDKMIDMLIPLLEYQPQIALCKKYENELLDYDLDIFRKFSFMLDRGSITKWYFNVFGISADTSKPWLIAPKEEQYKDSIIVSRSHRYRAPFITYNFLNKYKNVCFIGVPEEYNDIKKEVPNIKHLPVNDFLQMATIINSCKLFIGNQSFPFSIAEGLKVNRLLEVFYKCPNVIVEGMGANDFMYQPQFEYSVERLLNN